MRAKGEYLRSQLKQKQNRTHPPLVEGLTLDLSLLLQSVNDILVRPSDFVRQSLCSMVKSTIRVDGRDLKTHLDGAVFSTGLQTQDSQSLRDDCSLLAVVRRRNTLEELDAFESGGATRGLVGDHAADGPEEDAGG